MLLRKMPFMCYFMKRMQGPLNCAIKIIIAQKKWRRDFKLSAQHNEWSLRRN